MSLLAEAGAHITATATALVTATRRRVLNLRPTRPPRPLPESLPTGVRSRVYRMRPAATPNQLACRTPEHFGHALSDSVSEFTAIFVLFRCLHARYSPSVSRDTNDTDLQRTRSCPPPLHHYLGLNSTSCVGHRLLERQVKSELPLNEASTRRPWVSGRLANRCAFLNWRWRRRGPGRPRRTRCSGRGRHGGAVRPSGPRRQPTPPRPPARGR